MKKLLNQLSVTIVLFALVGLIGSFFLGAIAQADTIRFEKGSPRSGDVTKMTPDAVTITRGGLDTDIPTNKIVSISFSGEPRSLSRAREAALSERFEDAITALKDVDASKLTGPIAADAAFWQAFSESQIAMQGRASIDEAGGKLHKFIQDHPKNYHSYTAHRLMGDMLLAGGQAGTAATYYETLGKAPWPELQAESKILSALALAEAGKATQAQSLAQQAATAANLSLSQKAALDLVQAQCLISENKPKQAVRLIEKQLKNLPPEDNALNAKAYNMLGKAYRQAGQSRDALLAFLHVDLLYANNALAHAEALSNLAQLWDEVHKPERARTAKETLKQRYRFSRWSK
ncbi:MAG: hypothetical protein PVH19_05970 [Planctomycetia bacterium]